jgi:3'-phosphoadenosine 5'-phosphosulfate sulfotransferase (PAPS reductase)/FAD synthetase
MTVPDLSSYDRFVVAFSGGKDSLALLLHLIEQGVPREKIELHHHDVDGHGRNFMDWPITASYCRAIAQHFGVPIYFSWKEGGFEREMLRADCPTAPIKFETPEGTIVTCGGRGPNGTRRLFPQTSANLSVRWCSAYLKIDVLAVVIRNSPRFEFTRTLVLTGERAQESSARAKYATFEPHRTDLRPNCSDDRLPSVKPARRWVDTWRPVHAWDEREVWAIIERHGIIPHPAYVLGWSRLSCRQCIFGSANQWATIRYLYPEAFEAVAVREEESGKTIQRTMSIRQQADRGQVYEAAKRFPGLAALANGTVWPGPVTTNIWNLPAGAFGEAGGPT